MKVLIHNDMELWDFMTEGLKSRNDFIDIPLNRFCNVFQLVCRKKLWKLHLPVCCILGEKLRNILQSLKSGDDVIVSAYTQPALFHAIVDTVKKGVMVHLWMWNPIKCNPDFIYGIKQIRSLGVMCHSFDSIDCKKYDMKLHDSFYNMHFVATHTKIDIDFYFLGAAKDREKILSSIKKNLSQFLIKFLVPSDPAEYITYAENIRNINRSRCIVEVLQEEQNDMTLRPLEALTFRKKLLTNNQRIIKYPFYNPQNIFVFGKDDISNLTSFLKTPYVDIEKNVLMRYDINTWLDSF